MRNVLPFEGNVPCLESPVFVAPGAFVIGQVTIGAESSIWYNAIIRGDVHRITIGKRVNIQDGTVVHVTTDRFETWIGDDVTVGHQATLHGCRVESGAFIGMRAVVMDDVTVGQEAMIGAGALVPPGMVVPPATLVVGFPGKVIRELTPEELARNRRSASHYWRLASRHRSSIALDD